MLSSRILRASFVMAVAWPAAVPQAAARQPISRVREIARAAPGTPVTIHGVVTRYRPGRSLAVKDESGSIFVYTEGTEMLVAGDLVDVTGVADVDEETAPCVAKGTYRKAGTTDPPQPIAVPVSDLARGSHEADLVSVEGTLTRIETGRYEYGLVVRAGDVEFMSWVLRDLAGHATTIPPGSRVRITGAASLTTPTGGPRGFELLMRTGADAVVLQAASWWTPKRLSAAAVALGGTVALLFSYVLLLRRQVGRQTAALRATLQAESELKEQYRQAQKMEAVGRLAGGIAHDFNNIMTVVLGHSEILGLALKDRGDLHSSAVEIQHAAERAAALTRQLLAFGRRQKLEPSLVDLNVVARDMVALLARVLGGDIEVRADTAAAPVPIAADRAQLEQALLNLAVNARDAMPDGGRLALSVMQREARDGTTLGVLKVADTGTGIPPEIRSKIFDPFFTTKDVGHGSGLGLAMVYGFVQQSGATIEFESSIGVGTTFELTFPLAPGGAPGPAGC